MTAKRLLVRLHAGLQLALRYSFDALLANLQLAWILLTPRIVVFPQELRIPTRAESALEVMLLANLISFTPGTLTVRIEPGDTIIVHTIDPAFSNAEAIRERLEKPLLRFTRGETS